MYKTKNLKGKNIVGSAKVDFLETKYKEKQKIKTFNFGRFSGGIVTNENENESKKSNPQKFDLKNINFSANPNNPNDMDPVQKKC